jgi:hypothetical protein
MRPTQRSNGTPSLEAALPARLHLRFLAVRFEETGELHLDWEGEILVNTDVGMGGFSVSNVSVKVCALPYIFVCVLERVWGYRIISFSWSILFRKRR